MPLMLFIVRLPNVCDSVPVPYRTRLQQPLHAHVQVSSVTSTVQLTVYSASRSSLATGAKSHKLVKSDVSRILWYYYNDPVSLQNS